MSLTHYQELQAKQLQLQSKINQLQSELSHLPPGNLICTRNDTRYKWYHSHSHKITYIPKKNRSFAEHLAAKKYLSCVLKELKQQKKAVEAYLNHYPCHPPESEKLLTDESGYKELLLPYFMPFSQKFSQWMNTSYERNSKYPEQLIHKSVSGNLVRSKSEAMIDMYLFTHHIPFRYECALTLGEATLFPDFTILHPENGRIIYWEHFGRMDDLNYAKNVFSKLQLYNSYGITPTIQLITTYETQENPLTFETIENVLTQYFPCSFSSRQ